MDASTPASSCAATWFDGRTARAIAVRVAVVEGELVFQEREEPPPRHEPLRTIELSEPFGRAPRFAYLADGSTLEVHETEAFNRALAGAGAPPPIVARLQRSAAGATVALFALIAGFVFAYTNGIPALARWAAFAMPESVEARIGEQIERTLNLEILAASVLPVARQERIEAVFRAASARAAPGLRYVIRPRSVQEGDGVNAFALPGGTIVLLDGLVQAAPDDAQIVAVLAHELGHVAHKHGLRNVLQAFGIGALASAAWGDFAGVAANAPVVFGVLKYSRAFELEADDFAVQFLRANEMPVQPLIEFFESLASRGSATEALPLPDFLSTHPATQERIERLRRAAAVH